MPVFTSSYLKSAPFFNAKEKFGKFHNRHQCKNVTLFFPLLFILFQSGKMKYLSPVVPSYIMSLCG